MARASSPVKKVFGAPYMGVMQSLPEHEVAVNAVWSASNCMFLGGRVVTRWSMVPFSTVTGAGAPSFDSRPLGVWSSTTSAANFDIYVSTHTNLYRLRNNTGSWSDISGALTLTNGNTHTPRFASIYNQADGKTATVMVNGIDDNIVSLDGGNFATILVGARKGVDITTAASRLVAIERPYYVWWSDIFGYNFPALNFYAALDTPGKVIAIRNLGALGVCVYKEDAIVVGYSQPGSPAKAFRFETRHEIPGPAGPSAVVAAEGRHFLMTSRGRIGVFDGTRFDWIGDGVWAYLLEDFDYTYAYQTHGFYVEPLGQVWFVYPRVASAGAGPTGLAIVTLPRPGWGVPSYGVWPGVLAYPVSCSNTLRLSSGYGGLVLRSDAGNLNADWITDPLAYSTHGDHGTAFSCHLHTGLQAVGDITRIELEPFVTRAADHGDVTLKPVTAYTLDVDGGAIGNSQNIDLQDTTIIHGVEGFAAAGRFAGLRLEWTSRVPTASGDTGGRVVYKGAALYGYPLEQP